MDFLNKNKMAIGGGVVLLLAVYIYFAYFSAPSLPPLSSNDTNIALSQNLLVTLQSLHTIKLDNSIFSDPAFQSLNDFGVAIPSENVGRRNPFEPLAGSATPNSTVTIPASLQ